MRQSQPLAGHLGDVAHAALHSENAGDYDHALLASLGRCVGFEVGIVKRGYALSPACCGLDRNVAHDAPWDAIAAEMAPVEAFARAHGGVAVDVEVLGRRSLERTRMYRALMAPHRGQSTALLFVAAAGRTGTLVALGRTCARSFQANELRLLRRFVPILALAETRFPATAPASAKHQALSPRERALLTFLPLGLRNVDIALALGTSPRTVRNQLSRLYEKIGVANRTEAVGITALRDGADSPGSAP